MNLELLPNELFLDLFGYFDGINLLRAFYNLNSRFNFLLYKQFRFYSFKFQSVSKRNFDMICQQHLPFIADRVIALRLSNSNETPKQINLFFSYISSFKQFTQLRSLKLFNVYSYETLTKLLDQCYHLNNLTHLNFYCYFYENDQDKFQSIINNVWNLPKLIYCDIGIFISEQHHFCLPTIISSSLECVTKYYIIALRERKTKKINEEVDSNLCLFLCSSGREKNISQRLQFILLRRIETVKMSFI